MPESTKGILFVFIGTTLFSSKSILIQLAFQAGATVDQLMFVRMLLALPFYLLIGAFAWRKLEDKPNSRTIILICVSGFSCYHIASYLDMWALQFLSAGLERIVLFSYPAIIVMIRALQGQGISHGQIVGFGIAYCGVIGFFVEDLSFNPEQSLLAVLAVFIAACLTALYIIASQKYGRQYSSDLFTAMALGVTGFTIPSHFIATHGFEFTQISREVWLYGVILSLCFTLMASLVLNRGIRIIGAVNGSALGMIGPMLTLALAAVILEQPLTLTHVMATVTTICGVILVTKKTQS